MSLPIPAEWIAGVVLAILLNVTANRIPERFHEPFLRWGWFSIALYFTYLIMKIDMIERRLTGVIGGWKSLVIAALIGAIVAGVYWLSVVNLLSGLNRVSSEGSSKATEEAQTKRPDISAKFVYADSIALVLMNYSQETVKDPGYSMMLWNLDLPDRKEPLPVPNQNFNGDRIIRNQEMAPLAIVTLPNVAPLVKKGDRLFGFVIATCPDCVRARSYYVYAVHGENGWYYELPEGQNPNINALIQTLPDMRKDPERVFAVSGIPRSARHPIGEFQESRTSSVRQTTEAHDGLLGKSSDFLFNRKLAEVRSEWSQLNGDQKELVGRLLVVDELDLSQLQDYEKRKRTWVASSDYLLGKSTLLEQVQTGIGGWRIKPGLREAVQWVVEQEAKPQVNIVMLGEPRRTFVSCDEKFVFRECLPSTPDQRWAIVVDFRNQLEVGQEIKGLHRVLSQLTFSNALGGLSQPINRGFWLGQESPEAAFERGDTRSLFIGYLNKLPDIDQPSVTTFDSRYEPPVPITFSPHDSISVRIAVFTQTRNRFHKECELELTPNLQVKEPFA